MPKASNNLLNRFKPVSYLIDNDGTTVSLTITGHKIGPPSHRISLHQSNLKVLSARITRFDKHGPNEIEVIKINHLPTIQQVRLHGAAVMYPGRYEIELIYKIKPDNLRQAEINPSRESLPSIDETEAWQHAKFAIKR